MAYTDRPYVATTFKAIRLFAVIEINHYRVASAPTTSRSCLLQQFAYEREDEERENCAPDERVDHHDRPPKDSTGGGTECIGHRISGLSEELCPLKHEKADEVNDAQWYVCEQKRSHCIDFFFVLLQ